VKATQSLDQLSNDPAVRSGECLLESFVVPVPPGAQQQRVVF
jgi:hypothetical protein